MNKATKDTARVESNTLFEENRLLTAPLLFPDAGGAEGVLVPDGVLVDDGVELGGVVVEDWLTVLELELELGKSVDGLLGVLEG